VSNFSSQVLTTPASASHY